MVVGKKFTQKDMHLIIIKERVKGILCTKQEGV